MKTKNLGVNYQDTTKTHKIPHDTRQKVHLTKLMQTRSLFRKENNKAIYTIYMSKLRYITAQAVIWGKGVIIQKVPCGIMSIEFANGDLVVKWKFLLWLHKTSKLQMMCVLWKWPHAFLQQ